MRKILTILLYGFILSLSIFAQDKEAKEENVCPEISIKGPASTVKIGEMQTFTIEIIGEGVDEDKIKIKWEIERGIIVQGQETKTLVVLPAEGETVIATVNVDAGGKCVTTTSESGIPIETVESTLFDEFGNITDEDLLVRLDAFVVDLQNNPGAEGYIINYGGTFDISKSERFIKKHLNFRKFEMSRINFVNGGEEKEIRTRFWRVPAGGDPSDID